MKKIKLFLVVFTATTLFSCSNSDESKTNNSTNEISGTKWVGYIDKTASSTKGTYTLNFQKQTNICTMEFNNIVKNESGIVISNTTVTKTGTYTLDNGFDDRGDIIFPDTPSNKVVMYFANGQKFRIYRNTEILPSTGVRQNHLEVSFGKNYGNGAGFQVFFTPSIN